MGFSPLMRVDGLCQCAHSDSWIMWHFFFFPSAVVASCFLVDIFMGQRDESDYPLASCLVSLVIYVSGQKPPGGTDSADDHRRRIRWDSCFFHPIFV